MLLLNPSRAQRAIALGRQPSMKAMCHLALQHQHPPHMCTGALLEENPSLGGSSTTAGAELPGAEHCIHTWTTSSRSDVQITTPACWFSGKSCRIWLKGPDEKPLLLLHPPTQQQWALCTAAPTQAVPHDTAAIEVVRKSCIQSILNKRDLIYNALLRSPLHCPRSGLKALSSLWFQLFGASKLWGPRQQQLKVSAKFNFSGMRRCQTEP